MTKNRKKTNKLTNDFDFFKGIFFIVYIYIILAVAYFIIDLLTL